MCVCVRERERERERKSCVTIRLSWNAFFFLKKNIEMDSTKTKRDFEVVFSMRSDRR
jgi:hypothetical protein